MEKKEIFLLHQVVVKVDWFTNDHPTNEIIQICVIEISLMAGINRKN